MCTVLIQLSPIFATTLYKITFLSFQRISRSATKEVDASEHFTYIHLISLCNSAVGSKPPQRNQLKFNFITGLPYPVHTSNHAG